MASGNPGLLLYLWMCWNALGLFQTVLGTCTVPNLIDFESCLWNKNLAVSSGYDWKVSGNVGAVASWSRQQALSIPFSGFQGSGVDHTFGTAEGNFLLVPRSRNLSITEPSSVIESTEYVSDTQACSVSFFYRLWGLSPDRLRVSFVSGGTVLHAVNITVMATEWTKHTVQVPASISTFKVRFEAILLPKQLDVGYIALDDVRFSTSCCKDFRVPLRADFECGLQDYAITSANDSMGRWNWSLARPGISHSRPNYDNTLGHIQPGHFLFVDTLAYASKFAEFHSPTLPPTLPGASECFVSFWYIFGGGTLRLYQEDTSQSNRQLIWDSNKVAATNVWVKGFANLTSAADFHVVFQGYRSTPSGLELSIDDIEFSPSCWTRSSAPAVDYGLPGCDWIGYDTRSQSVARDRAESVLAKDLVFPCNGTVLSVSAYVSGPCIYNFYVATELPSVQISPPATYYRVKGLATQVVFLDSARMQTVSVSGMSFDQGDTILFERDRSRGLPGSIRSSSYNTGSFCLPEFPIAKLTSVYPTTGVNALKIEQSRCTFANQYAIRLNIMTNNPTQAAMTSFVPTTHASTTPPSILPNNTNTSSPTPDQSIPTTSATGVSVSPHSTLATTTVSTETTAPTTAVVLGDDGDTSTMSTGIIPYAIAGGVLGLAFIVMVILGIIALVKRRHAGDAAKVNVYQQNEVLPPHDTMQRANSNKPLVNPSYEDEIRLHAPSATMPAGQSREFASRNGTASSTLQSMPNGRHTNGNGHYPGSHRAAQRTRSDATEITTVSLTSTPSDTSPNRPDYNNIMAGDLRTSMPPIVPGDDNGSSKPSPSVRTHVYHLVDDGKGGQTPSTECTVVVEVPDTLQRKTSPTSGYQVPNEDMERGSEAEATLSSEFRSSFRYNEPPSNIRDMYAHLNSRTYHRLLRSQVELQTEVGAGEFGTVYAGLWHRQSADVHVAIKILQDGKTEKERVRFLREAAIMGQFSHRNIVKLIGVVAESDPLYIVLELMQDNLKNYLKSLRPGMPTSKDFEDDTLPCHLLSMCKDVASGMAYLDHKGFIHRDLAARNIMIDSERVCKVGDFGLARDLDGGANSYYVSQGGKVPIKWTAPEAIFFRKYSSASDVWSYGVLLYEIWSLAAEPYAWWDNKETFDKVKDGYRLEPPAGCPLNMYEMMIQCWHPQPHERPSFREILQRLELTDQDHLLLVSNGLSSNRLGEASELSAQPSHYRALQQRFAGESITDGSNTGENVTCV